MHCLVDGAIIIWNETTKEKCGYTEGKKVTAKILSNGMMISEQDQFAVVVVKESTHCGKKLWETDQDMLIYKHPGIHLQHHRERDTSHKRSRHEITNIQPVQKVI